MNKMRNHLALTSCQDMAEIMLPKLKQHGMTVFNYYKIYVDGSAVRLSTHREWTKHYFKKAYHSNTTVPSSYLTKPENYFLWLINDCPTMLSDAACHFDISNGITLAYKKEDYIEYYAFGATTNNTSIVNFYLNHLDVLKNYCHHFREKADHLLTLGENNKIQMNVSPSLTVKEKIRLDRPHSTILNLTHRQEECALLLLEGKQYKEISKALNLSVRTIEDHVNALKIKLQSRTITELIVKLTKIIR